MTRGESWEARVGPEVSLGRLEQRPEVSLERLEQRPEVSLERLEQ